MEFVLICLVAMLGSALTFFSGFGLGTVLLPVFALFFPVELAIALTAIVHFLNNLFKLGLTYKGIRKEVLLRFGLPSVLAAVLGALLLNYLVGLPPLAQLEIFGKARDLTLMKLTVAALLIFFALFDLLPSLKNLEFPKKYLPLGGFVSGFFGGLSGHQGALRSAFLIRAGLSKESFIATGIAVACMVDISRLSIYAENISKVSGHLNWYLVLTAALSAFAGAYFGNKLLKKITISALQFMVAVALMVFAVFLGLGII